MTIPSPSRPRRTGDWAIDQLPGLSDENRSHLQAQGIETTRQLFQQTRTPKLRQELASRLQIHIQHVNKWAALADLSRVPAIGCQYCGLLLHAGISSVRQLAETPLPRMHRLMLRLQVAYLRRQDLCPSIEQIATWIEQAKQIVRQDSL
ncbi:DUF4332 domain-containing protein [Leptolyngbya ohadii]|uniref:DUF4332 domain-containing protein n=1 Tax=Leptolyngbya ohadii TaxID=1962290 RepID=UPI000B59F17C|nr:DUF4332 domain-containing protein [Leptolyngbya ohadii]